MGGCCSSAHHAADVGRRRDDGASLAVSASTDALTYGGRTPLKGPPEPATTSPERDAYQFDPDNGRFVPKPVASAAPTSAPRPLPGPSTARAATSTGRHVLTHENVTTAGPAGYQSSSDCITAMVVPSCFVTSFAAAAPFSDSEREYLRKAVATSDMLVRLADVEEMRRSEIFAGWMMEAQIKVNACRAEAAAIQRRCAGEPRSRSAPGSAPTNRQHRDPSGRPPLAAQGAPHPDGPTQRPSRPSRLVIHHRTVSVIDDDTGDIHPAAPQGPAGRPEAPRADADVSDGGSATVEEASLTYDGSDGAAASNVRGGPRRRPPAHHHHHHHPRHSPTLPSDAVAVGGSPFLKGKGDEDRMLPIAGGGSLGAAAAGSSGSQTAATQSSSRRSSGQHVQVSSVTAFSPVVGVVPPPSDDASISGSTRLHQSSDDHLVVYTSCGEFVREIPTALESPVMRQFSASHINILARPAKAAKPQPNDWHILADPRAAHLFNSGDGFFQFACKSGTKLTAEEISFMSGFLNVTQFADEKQENNVPVVTFDAEYLAPFVAILVKAMYLLPGVSLSSMTAELIATPEYNAKCQPGNPKIWTDVTEERTFRCTKTIIRFVYSIVIQMKAAEITDEAQLRRLSTIDGVRPSKAIILERTKRNMKNLDSTVKCKSLLMYYEVQGGLLVSHCTALINTSVPTVIAAIVNNFGHSGAAEAGQTADLTRRYLIDKFGDSRIPHGASLDL